jgi:2-phospho-L-lactate guanylyltransferase
MRVVVPFDGERPKTRLSGTLNGPERRAFAEAMLRDVLEAIRGASAEPTVLATGPVDVDAPVTVDDRPLTEAVNATLAETFGTENGDEDGTVAVMMADLALVTSGAVRRLLSTDSDVVLVPGRAGGTNAFVSRHPDFRTDYHGVSYRDHRRIAREAGANVETVDSYRLSTDVDERQDLVEVLLHAEGRAADFLREAGFEVAVDGRSRVEVRRT